MFTDPSPDFLDRSSGACRYWCAPQKSLNVVRQIAGREVTLLRLLPQTFEADGFEIARHIRLQTRYRYRLTVQHLQDGIEYRFALERRAACEQLIKNRTERVNIGART